MKTSYLAVVAITAWSFGCGSTGSPSGPETPDESGTGTGTEEKTGTPAEKSATADESAAAEPEITTVHFVLHNDSGQDVFLVRDTQFMPLWLEIEGVQLNGYGQSWCGDDSGTHSEPFFAFVPVAANATLEWKRPWAPRNVSFAGSCWSVQPLSIGKHPARACLYDAQVDLKWAEPRTIPTGPNTVAPVSTWFTTAPSRCVDVDVAVPATGTATVDIHL